MPTLSLLSIFAASLFGSAHCAGMCGPFVAIYSTEAKHNFGNHLTYNLGRLTTYLFLGMLAGIIGTQINNFGLLIGLQHFATVFSGSLLLFWGLKGLISKGSTFTSDQKTEKKPFFFYLAKLYRLIISVSGFESELSKAFLLGTCSTLLPCGWLYGFVLIAAASAHPLSGLLIMLFFWTGTLPMMLGLGMTINKLGSKIRHQIPRLTSLLLLCAGLFAIFNKSSFLFSPLPNQTTPSCHTQASHNLKNIHNPQHQFPTTPH